MIVCPFVSLGVNEWKNEWVIQYSNLLMTVLMGMIFVSFVFVRV